jgi:hypothetical protein
MMLAALILQAAGTDQVNSPRERRIEAAFAHALQFDEAAYYQICGRSDRRARFGAMQGRAQALGARYSRKFLPPHTFFNDYVDRRAVGKCFNPKRFDQTLRAWSASLDVIDGMLAETLR